MRIKKIKFDTDGSALSLSDINDIIKHNGKSCGNPIELKMSRDRLDEICRSWCSVQILTESEIRRHPHIATSYGVIRLVGSDILENDQFMLIPAIDIDDEFEKIILNDK